MRKIAIASDHAGFEYKEMIKEFFSKDFIFEDFGTDSLASVDYPDFIHPAASAVESKNCELGILICGSGNGVSMTANKHQEIRCALCWEVELAELARQHNDANMLAVPARFVSEDLAKKMVEQFLNTSFEGGRHQNRVQKIACSHQKI